MVKGFKDLEDLAVGNIQEVPLSLLNCLENVKAARNQLISIQFKHCKYDDGKIYFNPKMKRLIDEYVGEGENYTNPDFKCHILDHLWSVGINAEIQRCDPTLEKKEFKKRFVGNKTKTCTIKLYSFYMIAELCKIFEGELLNDLNRAMQTGEIQLNRRITASGKKSKMVP